jgi:hypothetical protein
MIAGGLIAGGSFVMYGIGKIVFDKRVRVLEQAPEIREDSDSQYGFIQGPLYGENPIEHQTKLLIRLDESIYHITSTRVIGYELSSSNLKERGEKKANWKRKCEFVHRTAKQIKPILINNINIGVFIKSIPLKQLNTEFTPIHNIVNSSNANYINIINSNTDNSDIIGEHDREVIGVEKRFSGIKCGKLYTIFGEYDSSKQKMKKSLTHPNIVTKQTRDEFIQDEKKFARGWKLFWVGAFTFGTAIGSIGYLFNK